jgi:hypothetical protein
VPPLRPDKYCRVGKYEGNSESSTSTALSRWATEVQGSGTKLQH